jgi:Skp family chaperone for outer membrane proteins
VKSLLFSAMIMACGLQLFVTTVVGQPPNRPVGPPAPGAPTGGNFGPAAPAPSNGTRISSPVGVINMLEVFEGHDTFKLRKTQMDGQKEQAEKTLTAARDAFKAKIDRLKEFTPGSPEYSQLESELAQEEARMKVEVKKLNEKFIKEEGKMYYATYEEVLAEVRNYAAQMNMLLVLRYTGGDINKDNPEEIMKAMNEQVVYYNKAVDITQAVITQLKNRRPAQVNRPQPRPTQPLR